MRLTAKKQRLISTAITVFVEEEYLNLTFSLVFKRDKKKIKLPHLKRLHIYYNFHFLKIQHVSFSYL